jgi:adenylate cyclase
MEARAGFHGPFAELAAAARAVGHNLLVLDRDGPVRRAVPFVRVQGQAVPSLPLAVAALAAGTAPAAVSLDGTVLRFGSRRLALVEDSIVRPGEPVERACRALVNFRGPTAVETAGTFAAYSFYDLFYSEQQIEAGETPFVDPERFRDRIVLIGTTAAGLHDVFTVPFGRGKMPGVEIHANVVDNLLESGFVMTTPPWASATAYALAGLGAALASTWLGIWAGLFASAGVAIGVLAAAVLLFAAGLWLPLAGPLSTVALSAFGGTAYQYFVEGREKRRVRQLFARFVSPDVFSHLMADPARARLGGERRDMSVLFSDIRGFTTFTEAGKPEDVVDQLNEFFTRMVEVIFANGGTLDKFVGDMVMALFGAPLDDPDHADRAVRAALGMRAALADLNARWERQGRSRLAIGIGINSGEMIAGIIGAERIVSYTVIGDAVNLGARLESLNKEYGTDIIISAATRERLKGRYDSRRLGEVTVKGKTRPVEIFELRGEITGELGAVGPAA